MLNILLVLSLAIAALTCLHAIDIWETDYYVGFSLLSNDSALAVATVCDSLIAWGKGSYQEPGRPHESVESVLSRARALVHVSKDHVSAGLLLCHRKHMWLPAATASADHSLQFSNLLGVALWECTHFAGARAAFKLAESIMSAMIRAGRDCWALEADSVHCSEALMPAPAAVLLNAARVAADAWDFAAAIDFIDRSKILQGLPLPHDPSSPAATARASALEFSRHISSLHNKPGHITLMSSIVSRVLNISSFLRVHPYSPASLSALQSPDLWEGISPQTHLKRHNWPPRLVRDVSLPPMKKCNIMKSGRERTAGPHGCYKLEQFKQRN
jgi:hypothetical protein